LVCKTVISFNERLTEYDLGEGHPFRGDRFVNAMKFFEVQGLLNKAEISLIQPKAATREDLLNVHDEKYVDLIFNLAQSCTPYDIETPVSPQILEGALLIAGSGILCGKTVVEGDAKLGVSLGGGHHHAGKDYGGGFCLFNDVAVLVEYLRKEHMLTRFLILDHDVHFGNGTSDIYYRDPTVLYISLHQDPQTLYPGTGFVWQIGEDKGKGFNVNVPLPPGTGDETYLYALKEVFVPLAEEFKPQIIIANGGSDPHFADSLANLVLTINGFFQVSTVIRETADKVCNGKLVLMPGSGYNPETLPPCWYALIAGAAGLPELNIKETSKPQQEPPECRPKVEETLKELKKLLGNKWACFTCSNL